MIKKKTEKLYTQAEVDLEVQKEILLYRYVNLMEHMKKLNMFSNANTSYAYRDLILRT